MTSSTDVPKPRPQWKITEDYIDSLKGASKSYRVLHMSFLKPLKYQLLIQNCLEALNQELARPQDQIDISLLRDLLHEARVGERRVHRFINSGLGGDPLYAVPTDKSAVKALTVFGIPELCEMMLLHLGTKDLLAASQVNQTFAANISASSKLEQKLYLQGDSEAYWSSFFSSRRPSGIECPKPDIPRGQNHETVDIIASVNLQKDRRTGQYAFLNLPAQQLSMLICQPPITEMRATPACCRMDGLFRLARSTEPAVVIQSSRGITVAELIKAAKMISTKRCHCPFASVGPHTKHSHVHAGIYFEGTVTLQPDDPLFRPRLMWYSGAHGTGTGKRTE